MVVSFTVLVMAGRTSTALVALVLAVQPSWPRNRHRYSVLAVGLTAADTAPVDDEVRDVSSRQVLVPARTSRPEMVAERPAVRLDVDCEMVAEVRPEQV
jgi:hypothetical protein